MAASGTGTIRSRGVEVFTAVLAVTQDREELEDQACPVRHGAAGNLIEGHLQTLKVEDIDVDLWDKVMAVNIRGPFLMVKHVAPHMIARKYGKIVNIGSGTVARGIPFFSHYVTSKGAVTAFTRSISRELGEHGICVNTLAPGYTLSETGLQNTTHVAQSRANAVQRRALKRDEYPEDLLGTLIYLCSSDSDFVSGQVLAVDGGANNT